MMMMMKFVQPSWVDHSAVAGGGAGCDAAPYVSSSSVCGCGSNCLRVEPERKCRRFENAAH